MWPWAARRGARLWGTENATEENKHVVVQGRPQFGRIVLLVEADLGDPHDKYYIRLYS